MMYAFVARGDCAVVDEPLYAAYLAQTGLEHPMQEVILAAQPTDPKIIATSLCGSIRNGLPHFYQKHMTHHMLSDTPREWTHEMTHIFLIRYPARVIASYVAKLENPMFDDIGFRQQAEIYNWVRARQGPVAVVESFSIRVHPRRTLSHLSEAIRLSFLDRMLRWPKGGHKDDGAWPPASVWRGLGQYGVCGPRRTPASRDP